MKNFLLRAFRDACATKSNLFWRRCATSPLCPIYNESKETMEHILLLCTWVSKVIITALESFKHAFSSLLLSSTIRNSLPRGMHHLALWSPPPINRIKVNVDACWKRDSLCGKIRIVARDSFSGCKAVKSVCVHVSSAGMAEALAVLEGCLLAKCLQEQEVSWTPRSANMAADFVARSISPEMCGFVWVVQPPSSLVGILNKDGLPCPPM
ncbi:hypothetical protein ACFX13_041104 [Malus domestica]